MYIDIIPPKKNMISPKRLPSLLSVDTAMNNDEEV